MMDQGRKNRSRSQRKGKIQKQLPTHEQVRSAESCRTSAPGCSRNQGYLQNDNTTDQTSLTDRNGKNVQQQRHPASSSRTMEVPPNPSPSTKVCQSDSKESDLPGYYYDAEAKLYFKIQSYNLSSVAPFVTKDKIINKQKEDQRKVDIENLTGKKLPTSTCRSGASTQKQNVHIMNVLRRMQCGQFTCENLRTYMNRYTCSRIQADIDWDNSLPGQPSLTLGEIQHMEVSKKRDKIACVSSLKSSYSQIIQLMTVNEYQQQLPSKTKCTSIRVQVPFLARGPIHKRIKTMCWAPMQSRSGQATILYTTVCPVGCLASVVYLSNLEAEDDNEILFELNLGKHIIWSAAWSPHGHRFTIGAERRCWLIDIETRKQWTFNTFDSDPLSQLFSRCICTWDQRMRKKVMEYKGLMNSHWQLPFHLDETESMLTSTGSNSYTQIWDVRNGEIQRTIPPLYPVSCDNFPVSFYSTRWGNKDGNTALLVAMRNRFRFYTYKEVLQ
uniref:Uncharacterized protein n=1 Tax=Arion vulgaris TaxID=1028688 RepID=A0A0B7BKQ9_9EUPU